MKSSFWYYFFSRIAGLAFALIIAAAWAWALYSEEIRVIAGVGR